MNAVYKCIWFDSGANSVDGDAGLWNDSELKDAFINNTLDLTYFLILYERLWSPSDDVCWPSTNEYSRTDCPGQDVKWKMHCIFASVFQCLCNNMLGLLFIPNLYRIQYTVLNISLVDRENADHMLLQAHRGTTLTVEWHYKNNTTQLELLNGKTEWAKETIHNLIFLLFIKVHKTPKHISQALFRATPFFQNHNWQNYSSLHVQVEWTVWFCLNVINVDMISYFWECRCISTSTVRNGACIYCLQH